MTKREGNGGPAFPQHFDKLGASDDTHKLWRDMTDAEKGALLLAEHEGKVIEAWTGSYWYSGTPTWNSYAAYRVKPEPVREVERVTIVNADNITIGHGTIQTVDGKPDCSTINMEPLE